MATETAIMNRALLRCGAARIMSRTDNSKSARAVDVAYDGVRDGCLSIANWNFGIVRETLAATTAQDGYAYAYIIPSTWLRLIKLRDQFIGQPLLGARYLTDTDPDWTIETGNVLLTNFGPPLKALGVARITNTELYHPLFNNYLVLALANEIWEDVSRKSAGKQSTVIDERDKALSVARLNNAIMEAPVEVDDSSWLMSRVGP